MVKTCNRCGKDLMMKIDMDEISGKNLQMFMISGTGTAVKLKDSIASK